ncbi:MAG TPA: hypothetical protein VG602_01525 [Actinomycetota bacterium]|nr:hypothetical protein [Actinomycetota bacterium]
MSDSAVAERVPRRHLPTLVVLVVLAAALLLLTSCAPGPNPATETEARPGFWLGLWHGIIFPVTLVISLFTDNVSVYEVVNRGNWYDVGFFFGASMTIGGTGSQARRRNRAER